MKCFLFAFRLAYSGRSVHEISRSCGQQPASTDPQLLQVSDLTSRRLAKPLPDDVRPLSRLEQRDELLHLHREESP